uniref:Uncharacterized protein n=1 Tax=Kalanchoe fedtschenkoi TaxID=63787 RepID=A0A7N0UY88_KALFE
MGAPVEKINDVIEAKVPAAEGTPIAPITPVPAREVRDIRAPRPVVQCRLSKISAETRKESECCSPRTPKHGVFDPFAPGPDDMLLAPKLRKITGESRISVARQLNFFSSSSGESSRIRDKASSDEEKVIESVYGNLLHDIVPSGTEVDAVEKSAHDADSDGFKTPPSVPCLNGIPKKCPDAPTKQPRPISKRLHIDASLCRKLEF